MKQKGKGKGKKTYWKKGKKVAKISKPMKEAIKKIVDKEAGEEVKFLISRQNGQPVQTGTNPTAHVLSAINQATGSGGAIPLNDSSRIGDQVILKYVHIRGVLNPDSTYNGGITRVVVFQWKDDTSYNAPDPSKLFLAGMTSAVDSSSFFSNDNTNMKTFTVLYDRQYGEEVGSGTLGVVSLNIKIPMKYVRKKLQFNAGTLTGSGHIYIMFIGDRTPAGTNQVTYSFVSMVGFTDA